MSLKYNIDPKNFSVKGYKYIIVCDDFNKTALLFSKKLNLELGIEVFKFKNLIQDDISKINDSNSVIIVLGGDGFLLHVLHKFIDANNVKFYGVNFGTLGFLLNAKCQTQELIKHIEDSIEENIFPLQADIIHENGKTTTAKAINEISLLRQTNQASHIQIAINGVKKLDQIVCDGIVIATPAGSTAYNFSIHGPIFDSHSNLLSICPISPFRPRHWRGALINDSSKISITILQHEKRTTSLSCDFHLYPKILSAEIFFNKTKPIKLLFNKNKTLSDKILDEQFLV